MMQGGGGGGSVYTTVVPSPGSSGGNPPSSGELPSNSPDYNVNPDDQGGYPNHQRIKFIEVPVDKKADDTGDTTLADLLAQMGGIGTTGGQPDNAGPFVVPQSNSNILPVLLIFGGVGAGLWYWYKKRRKHNAE